MESTFFSYNNIPNQIDETPHTVLVYMNLQETASLEIANGATSQIWIAVAHHLY